MTEALKKIKFGTDGWRAIMGEEYTSKNVARMAQAFCDFLKDKFKKEGLTRAPKVAVGYDFRENSENFAAEVTVILLSNGVEAVLSKTAVPTPAVSRYVVNHQYDFGVAITASHNPGEYNGFKVKDSNGSSADQSVTKGIESFLDANEPISTEGVDVAKVEKDLMTPYLDGIRGYLKKDSFSSKKLNVLVDSMHGMGEHHIADLLKGSAVQVETIRSERDTQFGGYAPEPIAKNFPEAIEKMKTGKYDAGFVTDGDADRIGAVRPGGAFVSPGTLLSLIMIHMVEDLGMSGDVVTTVSNTALIYKVARGLGLHVHETPVGFKYIVEIMRQRDVLIAGEESGGLAFKDYMQERDGVLSALLIIQMMEFRCQTLDEILADVEKKYGKFLYARRDMHYPEEAKKPFLDHLLSLDPDTIEGVPCAGKNTADGVKFIFENDAWLLFRMSGTEPLLRVYSESQVPGDADKLVEWGVALSKQISG